MAGIIDSSTRYHFDVQASLYLALQLYQTDGSYHLLQGNLVSDIQLCLFKFYACG